MISDFNNNKPKLRSCDSSSDEAAKAYDAPDDDEDFNEFGISGANPVESNLFGHGIIQ